MDELDQPQVIAYYTEAGQALVGLLAGPDRLAGGWGDTLEVGESPTADFVTAAVGAGTRWFSWTAGPGTPTTISVTPGDGTDIATAATAALALIEAMATAGAMVVPATDGQSGLFVYVTGHVDVVAAVRELTDRAPEMATTDVAGSDGRALIAVAGAGSRVPVPYSLVDSGEGTGAVLPLTIDEVAAVTAGMPIRPTPSDLKQRLLMHGDLAAVLRGQ